MKKMRFTVFAFMFCTISLIVSAQVEFQEHVVTGSELDFMMVKHYKIKGTNFEIGKFLTSRLANKNSGIS